MASLRREILTKASPEDVWAAVRDIGALHTRLVPGFVVDTQLAPGERIVTFSNGMVVREPIVDIDDAARRLVWTAIAPALTHYNGSAQVFANPDGGAKVVWVADLLPNEAAEAIGLMMDQGMVAMKTCLDKLAEKQGGDSSGSPSTISATDTHLRKRVEVLDSVMSYVDVGNGNPIVFLHGNPTSSYLWRNVIPYLSSGGRCLAPDLVGMGQSGKSPAQAYRFADHARYLDAWFDALGLTSDIILVVHDWGSALGFHDASRHPERIRGIAYMEAIVQPRLWSDFAHGRDELFRKLRSDAGEQMILDQNFFIEVILPRSILRELTDEEMNAYRAPFQTRSDRLPMLIWPRELPIEGEPRDVVAIVEDYGRWLAASPIPKLFINAEPGALIGPRQRQFCRTWPSQREVTVKGIHYVQEDSPAEIGIALKEFVRELSKAGGAPGAFR